MAKKQKSRTTKSPPMQDWVFRLGVQSVYPSSKVRNIWFLSRLSFSQTLKMRQKQDISHHNFIEKFKNKFVKTSLWPSLPHMNTTKNHSRNFFLSLLYSNAFAKVFEGLLFHKVEVRSRNPIYFDFTLMRYLLRTKADKLFLCRANVLWYS